MVLSKQSNASHFFFEQINQGVTASSSLAAEMEVRKEPTAIVGLEQPEVVNERDEDGAETYNLGSNIDDIFD